MIRRSERVCNEAVLFLHSKSHGGLVLAESEKETNEVERTTAPGMKYTAKSALKMISIKLVPSPTASKNSLHNFAFVYFHLLSTSMKFSSRRLWQ